MLLDWLGLCELPQDGRAGLVERGRSLADRKGGPRISTWTTARPSLSLNIAEQYGGKDFYQDHWQQMVLPERRFDRNAQPSTS